MAHHALNWVHIFDLSHRFKCIYVVEFRVVLKLVSKLFLSLGQKSFLLLGSELFSTTIEVLFTILYTQSFVCVLFEQGSKFFELKFERHLAALQNCLL